MEFAEERLNNYTALFFASDYYASDAINIFFAVGVDVPNDISVVGFDDNVFATACRPALTTVQQNVSAKAYQSVEMLVKLIHNEDIIVKNEHLPIKLVIRQSVKVIN